MRASSDGEDDSPAQLRRMNMSEKSSLPTRREIYRAPRKWAEQNFHKPNYWNEVSTGGHFAAWEEPALFSAELRAAFRSLR
jgi:hypothetical protein